VRLPHAAAAVALTLPAGCGEPTYCTLIGGESGVAVVVDKGYAPKVVSGSLRLCVSNRCTDYPLDLHRSLDGPEGGTGLLQKGAKVQRTPLDDVDAKPVNVTLTLVNKAGEVVVEVSGEVTPSVRYPNGRQCEPRLVEASVRVDAAGAVTMGPVSGG